MTIINTRKYKLDSQILICIISILIVILVFFLSKAFIGYKIVALVLLMTVSLLAMLFEIIPVLLAAFLSAILWNFLFIPPIFTFHIVDVEDGLMFFLYFIIASVNAVLTFKIRGEEKKSRDKEEKENTIKLYNTLFNSLSHELRTPIATILGAVDTLKDNPAKLSHSQQTELLGAIDIAGSRLNRQVENLLNMSRLESGLLKLNLQWCDINEIINGVIHKIDFDNKLREIIFVADESLPICKIDSGIMEQIIHNIISNGIQYTAIGSLIKIEAKINQSILNIIITDNGEGIPPSLIQEIFKKFYRLPDTKTGGTGLGLSIVKGFVEAHNGSISVSNAFPHGLEILIELPVETSYLNNLKNE